MRSVKWFVTIYMPIALWGSCKSPNASESGVMTNAPTLDSLTETTAIGNMLDSFNLAAANADFHRYFDFYTDDATFLGTDATEHWNKNAFMVWAKPYFDKGKAWNFKTVQRHIYFYQHPDIAWFDELLSTQMKICRGSGVVVKQKGQWKIKQYVLSITFPNARIQDAIAAKASVEDSLIQVLIKH